MARRVGTVLAVCIACGWLQPAARAQERVTIAADVLLYGDNTEFRNPFREGETLFGAAPRLSVIFGFGEAASLELGAFANTRFGSDRASEQTRPVIALTIARGPSRFIFGTLQTPRVMDSSGPDRAGPHGLLPPLQAETLAFDRPYEAGLQWTVRHERLRHDAWLSWQQLNTPEHRERFNGGVNIEYAAASGFSVPVQFHVVHHGGQRFASGPVADSYAVAGGLAIQRVARGIQVRAELLGFASRHVPDRERPDRSRTGRATFARASLERGGWGAHTLFWRGKDFVKEEGDANYLSIRRNGTYYGGIRDYAEAGVTRRVHPAPQVRLEVSGRLHRVERHYGYSYRVVAVIRARWRLKE
jgi:hypothetical protein